MDIIIRDYVQKDLDSVYSIWNQVIEEGNSFYWDTLMPKSQIQEIIDRQDKVACAENRENGEVVGFYILHKNNPGRGSHIANALYAVQIASRGRGIGEKLGKHSIATAKSVGYHSIQFNSVVSNNSSSIKLWEKLGFKRVGTIKNAFLTSAGTFADIYLYFRKL